MTASPRRPLRPGTAFLWWVLLLPLAFLWMRTGNDYHADRTLLPVAIVGIIAVRALAPRWVPVAVAVALWRLWVAGGNAFSPAVIALVSVQMLGWGLLAGTVPGPPRRVLAPAAVVLAATTALMIVRPNLYGTSTAITVALALPALLAPARTARVLAPLDPWSDRVARAWDAIERACAAVAAPATRLRRAAIRGDFPSNGPVGDQVEVGWDVAGWKEAGGWRGWRRRYRTPFLIWLGTFVTVNFSRVASPPPWPAPDRGWFDPGTMWDGFTRPEFLVNWGHWDSAQYLDIARNGYGYEPGRYALADGTQEPVAWMPGYGLLIRYLSAPFVALLGQKTVDDVDLMEQIAVLITFVAGWASLLLFWKWLTMHGVTGRSRVLAVLLLAWFPYSFMLYGASYSDPLFLALVLLAFVLLDGGRPIAAGLAGAAATLVRPNGMALIAALFVAAATHPAVVARWRSARGPAAIGAAVGAAFGSGRRVLLGALVALAGLLGFVAWCWIRYDEPLLYWNAHAELFGHVQFTKVDLLKLNYFPSIARRWDEQPGAMVNLLVEGLLTVVAIVSIPAVARRFSPAAATLVVGQVAIIWFGSFDFIGAGRYLICVFPIFALWGEWLGGRTVDGAPKRPSLPRRVTTVGLLGLGATFSLVFTYLFANQIDIGW